MCSTQRRPAAALAPGEAERLNAWFQGLGIGYGDSIYVDGGDAYVARQQVAAVAGNYGMMVSGRRSGDRRAQFSPDRSGSSSPAAARLCRIARTGAGRRSPTYNNRSMSNFGCAVNTDLAAMVANPEDLVHGQEGTGTGDTATGAKAVNSTAQLRRAEPRG